MPKKCSCMLKINPLSINEMVVHDSWKKFYHVMFYQILMTCKYVCMKLLRLVDSLESLSRISWWITDISGILNRKYNSVVGFYPKKNVILHDERNTTGNKVFLFSNTHTSVAHVSLFLRSFYFLMSKSIYQKISNSSQISPNTMINTMPIQCINNDYCIMHKENLC